MRDAANKYELLVAVKGQPVREYFHDNSVYVEGRKGSEYTLQVKNNTDRRICAIVSVDGLSVINGKPAGHKSDGFVIEPYSSSTIEGWVKNSNRANRFEFDSRDRSYSNRSGEGTNNIGVIGMMVFEESTKALQHRTARRISTGHPFFSQDPYWKNLPVSLSGSGVGQSFGVNNMSLQASGVGTGYGEETRFETTEVKFEKRDPNNPDALMALYYDDRKGLERKGIVVDVTKMLPKAFPSYQAEDKYCKPPLK